MLDEGVSSVQPREAAFAAHNARVQDALRTSAAASTATNNWWRTEAGHISVVNPLSGRALRRAARRQPRWADWKATRGGAVVDVAARERERQRRAAVAGLAAVLALWLLFLYAV